MAPAQPTLNPMRDAVAQTAQVLGGMWNYRWLALVVSWVAAIVAVTVALKVPSQYEASARIYVDT